MFNTNFFGQFGTDQIIREHYFPNYEYQGVMVDVGAYNSHYGSNSFHFENNGWQILAIDPVPEHVRELQANRNAWVLEYAISDRCEDDVPFTLVNVDGGYGAVSALDPDPRLLESHRGMIKGQYTISVSVRTLDWILKSVGTIPVWQKIDVISIDTEGGELAVLQGFDPSEFCVDLLVVENNYADNLVGNYMESQGYKLDRRHEVNEFYVRIK